MRRHTQHLAILATLLFASAVCLANWPQFQGPHRDGSSPETGLLKSFPAGGPRVLWTLPVSDGFGGPAIRDGMVYFQDRRDDRQDALRCVGLETGKELWTFAYDAPGKVSHNGPRCVPAVDDKYVFTIGQFGHFHCIDRKTHQSVWSKNIVTDFGAEMPRWAAAQSALLYKDWVIAAPQSPSVGIIACERATGKIVWKSPAFGEMKYVTPALATIAGVDQILMISATTAVGVDAATGKQLWSYSGWQCRNPIPQPLHVGDGRVLITGGYDAGSVMLQVRKSADGAFQATELFRNRQLGSQLHNPALVAGHLYFSGNTNSASDGLVCMDLEGKLKWQTRRQPPMDRGHMILADGLLWIMAGGTLRLVQPDPAGFKELAAAPNLLGGREIWAPMALTDAKLVLRDQRHIKCLDIKAR